MFRIRIPLLLIIFSFALHAQEPLWRKGGSFPHVVYQSELSVQPDNNIGLHYNKKDIYVVGWTGTIEHYDSTTLVRKTEPINANGIPAEVSPHCSIIVLHAADSLKLYDVKKRSVIFSRKGQSKVVAFSDDSRYTLFDDGSVIDLNDTVKPEPLKVKTVLNNMKSDTKADWSKNGKVILWNSGSGDSIRIYDVEQNANTYIPFKFENNSVFRFSPTGKTAVAFTDDTYTVFTIENGIPSIISKDEASLIGKDYYLLDDDLLIIFQPNQEQTKFILYHLLTNSITNTINVPSASFGILPRFVQHDTSIVKGALPLVSYETSGCGGMPMLTNALLHFLKISSKPIFQTIPNQTMECIKGMCFMEGDTTVATVNCNNTIVITEIKDGKIKRQWDIPKHIYEGRKLLVRDIWVNTQLLTAGEYLIFPAGNMLYRFSVERGKITDSIRVSDSAVTFITHSLDKKYILACSDKTIYAYESGNFSFVKNFAKNQKILNASLNTDTLFYTFSGSAQISKTLFSKNIFFGTNSVMNVFPILSLGGQSAVPSLYEPVVSLYSPYGLKFNEKLFAKSPIPAHIKRIINVDKYWVVVNESPEMMGVPGSASIRLVKEINDSLSIIQQYSNYFSCFTDNIILSEDGEYCVSLGREGTMELHEISSLPVSIQDNEQIYSADDEGGYTIEGEYLYMNDTKPYKECTLFSVTGEMIGICSIAQSGTKTVITIPQTIQNGFYIMALNTPSGTISKKIIINR